MGTAAGVMPVYENEQGYMDTWGVGGDRFSFLSKSMFAPDPFIGTTTLVPEALLSIPPTYGQMGTANAAYGSAGASARVAASNPWSPQASPLPWVIVALIVGVWGIHTLYFKRGKKK